MLPSPISPLRDAFHPEGRFEVGVIRHEVSVSVAADTTM